MPFKEKVIWTVCPQGKHAGGYDVNLFVSPRLTLDGAKATAGSGHTLSEVPSWSDWPAVVNAAHIGIAVVKSDGTSDTIPPDKITWRSKPRSDVYQALFDGKTPLNDYEFADLSNAIFLSYPAGRLADLIGKFYGRLGLLHARDLPRDYDMKSQGWPYYHLDKGNETPRPRGRELLQRIRRHGLEPEMASQDLGALINLVGLFHRPLLKESTYVQPADPAGRRAEVAYTTHAAPKMPTKADVRDGFDFHRIAGAAGNHYDLARLCGLVLELTLPVNSLPAGEFRLKAMVHRAPGGGLKPVDVTPRTVCVTDAKSFRARALNEGRFENGQLTMSGPGAVPLALVQMDVDGAAHKAAQLGHALDTMYRTDHVDDEAQQPQGADAPAPSLRSAGIMLAQTGRHVEVKSRATTARDRNTAVEKDTPDAIADIHAEDLVRGYRADIADVTKGGPKTWRSLCQRIVFYDLAGDKAQTLPDLGPDTLKSTTILPSGVSITRLGRYEEGTLSLAVGSAPGAAADEDPDLKDVYTLHEALFVWRGWSLCAPEPAKSLVNKPRPVLNIVKPPARGLTPVELEEKRHQAMVGPSVAEPVDGFPMPATYKVRPGTLPPLRFGHTYRARLRVVDLTGASVPSDTPETARTVTPETTYKRFEPVEAPVVTLVGKTKSHAMPVSPSDSALPKWGESMTRLALRTENTGANLFLPKNTSTVQRNLAPPRVTQRFAEMHGVIDNAAGAPMKDLYAKLAAMDNGFPEVAVPQADPPEAGAAATTTRYMISEPKFLLPYLPDPFCAQLHVCMKSVGDSDFVHWVDAPLYSEKLWPDSGAVMIEGAEKYTALYFDPVNRVVQVPMPKGCRQRVRISAKLPAEVVKTHMALWDLIVQSATTAEDKAKLAAALTAIEKGEHWMFTPWREIEFVHAVQRPLVRPQFSTSVTPPALPLLERDLGELDARMTFGTPVSGLSTVRLDIRAAWSEPDDNPADIDAKSEPVVRKVTQVVHQRTLARTDGKDGKPYVFTGLPHPFHDTRYRRVTYHMDALSRFREFFPKAIRDSAGGEAMTVQSGPFMALVPNSAPPPAPKVLYVIPTFGWLAGIQPGIVVSKRTAGIRIYLDRPWMTTGYNEMLAVILPPKDSADASGDDAANHPFVTQWGRDPAVITNDVTTNSPPRTSFTLAKWAGPITCPGTAFDPAEGLNLPPFKTEKLPVPGQGGRIFDVAPHQVSFDKDRQLWYADVSVTVPRGQYFPFLRLAVARYQPVSVAGAHLSAPVTCDFIQLSPDRVAVMVPGPAGSHQYDLFIFGSLPWTANSNLGVGARIGTGKIRLRAQMSDAPMSEDLGWMEDASFKIIAEGASFKGPENLKGAVDQVAKFTKMAPVKGQTFDPAGIWDDTPPLIYWARFETGSVSLAKKRQLLITESETYAQDAVEPGERIVYAARMPL